MHAIQLQKSETKTIKKHTLLLLFPKVQPKNNWICVAVKMITFHLLWVIYRRLELQPIHHTTIIENEIRHDSFQCSDRQVQLDRIDFSMKIIRLNMIQANDHL